ncbi:MAG: hypothetical protein ACREUF_10135 [Solimonas sp.]
MRTDRFVRATALRTFCFALAFFEASLDVDGVALRDRRLTRAVAFFTTRRAARTVLIAATFAASTAASTAPAAVCAMTLDGAFFFLALFMIGVLNSGKRLSRSSSWSIVPAPGPRQRFELACPFGRSSN